MVLSERLRLGLARASRVGSVHGVAGLHGVNQLGVKANRDLAPVQSALMELEHRHRRLFDRAVFHDCPAPASPVFAAALHVSAHGVPCGAKVLEKGVIGDFPAQVVHEQRIARNRRDHQQRLSSNAVNLEVLAGRALLRVLAVLSGSAFIRASNLALQDSPIQPHAEGYPINKRRDGQCLILFFGPGSSQTYGGAQGINFTAIVDLEEVVSSDECLSFFRGSEFDESKPLGPTRVGVDLQLDTARACCVERCRQVLVRRCPRNISHVACCHGLV